MRASLALGLKASVSVLALAAPQMAFAGQDTTTQDPAVTAATDDPNGPPPPPEDSPPPTATATDGSEIIITGIRASLRESMNIKRNAQGVVDAISSEDIGKFPDTNLAESLQRITGVSIDRTNGEGTNVTVRGFGPEFNLVLLNGRQMPTSSLGDGASPPSSRSFDFGNLASEGIASVEVYKSGRATLPTGGIGSVINIRTPRPLDRPGFRGSLAAKAVFDHGFDKTYVTPEFSGIISNTFADNRVGILVTGSYQRRKSDLAQFSAGWREGFLGTDSCDTGNWGALPQNDWSWCGNPANITNRPEGNDIYQLPQNAAYDFISIDRKRINGQAVLQVRPTDTLTGTIDYTFSQNTVDASTNSIGIWFTHTNGTSVWTDGPVAGAEFVSEAYALDQAKDLAITGAVAKNRSINRSLGGNLRWDGPGGFRAELDAHHSTAESKPTSPYGSSIAVGSAIFGIKNHSVDFTSDMPVISVDMYPGSEIDASNIRPSGNAFRTAYMKDRIDEVTLRGGYDFDTSFLDAIDFGVTLTDNKVRSAYGFLQNETWTGTLSAADTPDDLYKMLDLPDHLKGMGGTSDPSIIPNYFAVDTEGLINYLESKLGICSDPQVGDPTGEGCLADFSVDRRIREKSFAPYIQSTSTFDLFGNPAHLRLGLRYERTKVNSASLTPIPVGVIQYSENEMGLVFDGTEEFLKKKGQYKNWLPAVDFDVSPLRDVKLRASYSHTITRADYGSLQGGLTLNPPLRPNGGSTANSGNTDLLPYKSKNIDLSAEWYYGKSSYISAGFFHKKVSNFIGQFTTIEPLFGLTNPSKGAAEEAARAALGGTPSFAEILAYLDSINSPVVVYDKFGVATGVRSQPGDPLVDFIVSRSGNSDEVAKLHGWEFALQHNFWDTGFGVILNYTIVKSNAKYDNTLRFSIPQFAVPGVSDSANAVLFYDKNGLQARVAYNWRDKFLSAYGLDPFYVEEYGQFDVSASYEFKRGITAFFEGINVTNADRRGHRRSDLAAYFAQPGYARYAAGLRVSFGGNAPPPPPPPPVIAPPPPPPAPPPTQTCPDGTVILASDACPAPPPPPPPPPPAPERGW